MSGAFPTGGDQAPKAIDVALNLAKLPFRHRPMDPRDGHRIGGIRSARENCPAHCRDAGEPTFERFAHHRRMPPCFSCHFGPGPRM